MHGSPALGDVGKKTQGQMRLLQTRYRPDGWECEEEGESTQLAMGK